MSRGIADMAKYDRHNQNMLLVFQDSVVLTELPAAYSARISKQVEFNDVGACKLQLQVENSE